jgi:hypothetical protein
MPEQDYTLEMYNKLAASGVERELPKYRCHKIVHAFKIERVNDPTEPGNESDGSRILCGEGYVLRVNHEYVRKHKPEVGGYLVIYEDGYQSFSPAKAFEDGYTRI